MATNAPTKRRPHKPTDEERAAARAEFYRIVRERLDARIDRGEAYTTSRDLYAGYEELHRTGFGEQPPSQSVAQVLSYARYRDRLFYARDAVTHKAERSGPGRAAPYRIYLRADAVPPSGYVLVPIGITDDRIAEYIARAKGATDATVHVRQEPPEAQAIVSNGIDFEALAERLTNIVKAQAETIDAMIPALVAVMKKPVGVA